MTAACKYSIGEKARSIKWCRILEQGNKKKMRLGEKTILEMDEQNLV